MSTAKPMQPGIRFLVYMEDERGLGFKKRHLSPRQRRRHVQKMRRYEKAMGGT